MEVLELVCTFTYLFHLILTYVIRAKYGIGLDDQILALDPQRIFQISGSQRYGNHDYHTYGIGGEDRAI